MTMLKLRKYLSGMALLALAMGMAYSPNPVRAQEPYTRRIINLPSGRVRSEVALGDVDGDGIDDIVVGSDDGVISAYRGNGSKLWSYDTGDAAIEGKAAIADINLDGHNEVIVGVGSTFTPKAPGGVVALSHNGGLLWRYVTQDFNGDGVPEGVHASPAVADVDNNDGGRLEIIFGSFDGYVRVLNDDGSLVWETFTRDTIWSSPAVGDIDRDGKPEIVIGNDSHYESYYNTIDGGRILVMNAEDGTMVPGFPIAVDETIWSSPVLADITQDGWLDIIVGTGDCWTNPACAVPDGSTHPVTTALYGWDHNGHSLPGWPIPLPVYTMASPTITDLDNDDQLEVVINTDDGHVYAFEGDGTLMPGWPAWVTTPASPGTVVHFGTHGSMIAADLTGDGNLEIIVPSNWELVVFDSHGTQLTADWCPSTKWSLSTEYTIAKTAAVGDVDNDGRIELIAGGARSGGTTGAIYIWDFEAAANSESMPWPFARLNTQNEASFKPAPALSVSAPEGIILLHAYGSGETLNTQLRIASLSTTGFQWQLSTPAGVTASAYSGNASADGIVVTLFISTKNLTVRNTPYSVGNLVISAWTSNGSPVLNSPITIPIRVSVVEKIYRTYVPLTSNRH